MPEGDYESLDELKATEDKSAWHQTVCNRNSCVTVVAPHGKSIEPFTELIAAEIASDDYNLFVFEGLRRKRSTGQWLHVRSENFKDEALAMLQAASRITLSVHGAKDIAPLEKITWIGGNNNELRELVWDCLASEGFRAKCGEGGYAGADPNNFVNRTPLKGVQLEISRAERESLADNSERLRRYVEAIRNALIKYILEPT